MLVKDVRCWALKLTKEVLGNMQWQSEMCLQGDELMSRHGSQTEDGAGGHDRFNTESYFIGEFFSFSSKLFASNYTKFIFPVLWLNILKMHWFDVKLKPETYRLIGTLTEGFHFHVERKHSFSLSLALSLSSHFLCLNRCLKITGDKPADHNHSSHMSTATW